MSKNSDPEKLARQISDGKPIDWSGQHVDEHDRSALALLEKIAATFRQSAAVPATGQSWGSLEVGALLGEGSYGAVYRAFDPLLSREVALKLSNQAGAIARRWVDEGRRLARVRHANVVTVHGADVHDGKAGIWFELIEGIALDQWVTKHGTMGPEEVVAAGQTLCAALAAIHGRGLVHGDVKPANILRETGGRLVLVDFGSASDLGEGALRSGSPGYLAPELLAGQASPGAVTDLYALGQTLRVLLTGQTPTPPGQSEDLLDARPDLPPDLIRALNQTLATDPADRPQTAGQFSSALARSLTPVKVRPRMRRAAIAAALILLMVAAGWTLRPGGQPATMLQKLELVTRDAAGVAVAPSRPLDIGAPLSLRFANAEPVFVYVVNQDDAGKRFVLYPLADPPAAVAPGSANILPGQVDGRWVDWQISSASAREQFAVFASPARLQDLEQLFKHWSRAGDPARGDNFRGVGDLAVRAAASETDLTALVALYDRRSDVEARLLTLPVR